MQLKQTFTEDGARAISVTRSISVENLPLRYQVASRNYTGIPSVECTGEHIWCLWQTGGDKEPHPENYCVLAYSDNGGESFVDSALIFEAFFEGKQTNVFIPMIITDEKGQLIVLFSIKGRYYATVITNPTAPIEEIEWQEPRCIYEGINIVNKPLKVKKDGKEVWYFFGDTDRAEYTTVIEAKGEDKLSSWEIVGKARTKYYPHARNLYHEPMAIELEPGNFWLLKRLEKGFKGGLEQSFSYDWGRTWTDYEAELPYPFICSGSKFTFKKLNSGNILLVTHDTTEDRSKLIAHLSSDGGKSFPYSLMLDERGTVSYPETCEDKDGTIYIAYDKGRMAEYEIRIAKIREEDIIAGKPVAPGSRLKIEVSRASNWTDVKEIVGFDVNSYSHLFSDTNSLLSLLPEELTVKTSANKELKIFGYWSLTQSKKGKTLAFITRSLPYNITDTYGNLKFEIED